MNRRGRPHRTKPIDGYDLRYAKFACDVIATGDVAALVEACKQYEVAIVCSADRQMDVWATAAALARYCQQRTSDIITE